jgi:hypothetical protein
MRRNQFLNEQEDCVEVWIEIVPIKRSSTKED